MNKTQKAYAEAKAAMEAANELSKLRIAPYEYLVKDDSTDAELELFFTTCEWIDSELKIKELAANLHKAEDEMVTWANAKVSKSKHFNQMYKQAMNEVMAAYNKQYSIRTKMVELSFKLA